MAVIAVYSVKGGVGKTTLAANLAWLSATVSCRKTLLWDLDASGGSAFLLGSDSQAKGAAKDVFAREADAAELIERTQYPNLDLLPADESLRGVASLLSQLKKRRRLAKLTGELGKRYERIVLDCPPVLDELSAQVLRAATCVIVPIPPSPLSLRAFKQVVQQVGALGEKRPPLLPVFSMVDRRRTLHGQALADHPDWPLVSMASAVEQCAVRRQPVGAFAPRSPAAREIGRLWEAIERRVQAG